MRGEDLPRYRDSQTKLKARQGTLQKTLKEGGFTNGNVETKERRRNMSERSEDGLNAEAIPWIVGKRSLIKDQKQMQGQIDIFPRIEESHTPWADSHSG